MGVQKSNAGMAEQHERDPTRLYRPTMSTLYKFELGEFAEQSEGMAQQQQQQVVGRKTTTTAAPRAGRVATPTWRSNTVK